MLVVVLVDILMIDRILEEKGSMVLRKLSNDLLEAESIFQIVDLNVLFMSIFDDYSGVFLHLLHYNIQKLDTVIICKPILLTF